MLQHPYSNLTGGQWLRGNLHTHTTRSDGSRPQQAVIDDYAGRGYGFLALSDHDVFTSHDDYASLQNRGMVLIPGNEVTAHGPHLQHVNGSRRIEPVADRAAVLADAASDGGFTVINHPNWQDLFNHCTIADLRAWRGYAGIEIYNGVIQRLEGTPYALDKWDMLLSGLRGHVAPGGATDADSANFRGRRVWGFANDDSHAAEGDVELGWNTAYVKDRTAAGVVEALVNGRFYASTGVTIDKIAVAGNRVAIESANATRISVHTAYGRRITFVNDRHIEFDVPENVPYVRFTCWGEREQFAWTQPFWT